MVAARERKQYCCKDIDSRWRTSWMEVTGSSVAILEVRNEEDLLKR